MSHVAECVHEPKWNFGYTANTVVSTDFSVGIHKTYPDRVFIYVGTTSDTYQVTSLTSDDLGDLITALQYAKKLIDND